MKVRIDLKMLLDVAVENAKELGFKKVYLFAFDPAIPAYYQRLGWKIIGMDAFKFHPVTLMELHMEGKRICLHRHLVDRKG